MSIRMLLDTRLTESQSMALSKFGLDRWKMAATQLDCSIVEIKRSL
jgi:hypothetical protein